MSATLFGQATAAISGAGNMTAQIVGVPAGALLTVLTYERDGGTFTSVSDDLNGAWTLADTRAAVAARIGIHFFVNSAAGNPTLTVAMSSVAPRDISFAAWTGIRTLGSVFDTVNDSGNSGVTSHQHGTVTPSDTALLLTVLGSTDHGGVVALHSGFVALSIDAGVTNANRRIYAYRTGYASGAINPTHDVTSSSNSDTAVAAFLEAATGPTLLPFRTTISAQRVR